MARAHPDLEVDEDRHQQHVEWRVERIAWPLLYLLLAALGFGLLGDGPIGRTEVRAGGLAVEHARLARRHSEQELVLTMTPTDSQVAVAMSTDILRKAELASVVPLPREVQGGPDETRFIFRSQAGKAMQIQLRLKATEAGVLRGRLRVDDGPAIEFSQFVVP